MDKKEIFDRIEYVHLYYLYFIPVGRHKTQEIPNGTLDGMVKAAGLDIPSNRTGSYLLK